MTALVRKSFTFPGSVGGFTFPPGGAGGDGGSGGGGGEESDLNTTSELAALDGTGLANGERFYVRGRASALDGGQGWYLYQSTAADVADGVVIVQPADNVGRFIRAEWQSENIIKVRWWTPFIGSTVDAATNGALLGQVFDFITGQPKGGECIFPWGIIYVERATAYTFTKKRSWRFRGAGDGGKFNSGSRIYLRGGGMDYFIKYRSVLQFHWSDIQFLIQGSGIAGVFDVGAANFYNGNGFTPIPDPDAISSYLCSWSRMTFNSDIGGGFGPSVAYIWLHATVSCTIDTCWFAACDRALKLGEAGLLATDPDGNTLAKGSCGQIRIFGCIIDGDIGYMRASNISIIGGQTSVGPGGRAMILEQMPGADICHAITFSCTSIGGVGDHSAPFIQSTIATNITIGRDCVVGRYSTVAVADGESTGWDISPCINVNTNGKPSTGILQILPTCTGTNFECNTTPNSALEYIIKDERPVSELVTLSSATSPRSLLHNSKFDVWRRGTSLATTTQQFLADRWKGHRHFDATGATFSRQTGFFGSQYCIRMQRNVGNTTTELLGICQQVFSADCYKLQGKHILVTAGVRKGADFSGAGSFMCVVYTGTGIDEPVSIRTGFTTGVVTHVGAFKTITATETYYTWPVDVAANATELAVVLRWTPIGTAGTNDYCEITNVNLTVGNQITPYVPAEAEFERDVTMPYCQKSFVYGTAPAQNVGVGTGEARGTVAVAAATTNRLSIPFERRMWGTPTIVLYNPAAVNAQVRDLTAGADCSAAAATGSTERGIEVSWTGNAASAVGNQVGIHYLATAGI